jgi:hypothetical protein
VQDVVEARTITRNDQVGTVMLSAANLTDQRSQPCRVDELRRGQVHDQVPAGSQNFKRGTERRDGRRNQFPQRS